MRFGQHTVFMPALLKPAPARLRLAPLLPQGHIGRLWMVRAVFGGFDTERARVVVPNAISATALIARLFAGARGSRRTGRRA